MKTSLTKTLAIILSLVTMLSICFVPANAATSYTITVKTGSSSTIKNVGSNKMLNVYGSKSANNTNITVYQNDNTSGQQITPTAYNGAFYFTFKCSTSRALNIYGTSCKENANVCIWNITKNPTQLWILEYVPSKNAFIIRSKSNTNYCLTANGSSNSSNVCIKKYTGSSYQLWTSSLFSAKANNTNNTSDSVCNMIWPIADGKGKVTHEAGEIRSYEKHAGADIGSCADASVISIADGTVLAAGFDNARGNYVAISHNNGYFCVYQHMKSTPLVKKNDKVKQGQKIGVVGNTGNSYGAHLHFEIAKYSSLTKTGTAQNYLYNDIKNKKNPTYYTVSKGTAVGSYYELVLKNHM